MFISGWLVVLLQAQKQAKGAGELTVQAHLVAENFVAGGAAGQGMSVDGITPSGGFGLVGVVVGVIGIGLNKRSIGGVEMEVVVDVFKLAGDFGGFGAEDAAQAPEAIGDFADEALLEDPDRLEFGCERGQKLIVIGGLFFEVGAIDDDIMGIEAVFNGVVADAPFSLGGFGAGGFFGVGAISLDPILADIFGHGVPLI